MSGNLRRRSVVAGMIGCLAGALLFAGPAHAEDGPFTIDGIVPDNAGMAVLEDDYGNIKELGPLNSSTTKIGVIHNDAVPTLGLTNPNAQVDLRRAWIDAEKDGSGDDWLYFAWERDSNNGSGFIAYEFMQNPVPAACDYDLTDAQLIAACNPWKNRQGGDASTVPPTPGDFMILWDQQGGSTQLYLRVWSGTAPNLTLTAPQALNTDVSSAQYSADRFKGEAAVNLTETIYGGVQRCLAIATTIPSTVTGNSDTADYKDTILVPSPVISNCQSTTVTTPETAAGEVIGDDALSIATGVVAVRDSAVISLEGGVGGEPSGSVDFFLCGPDAGLCDEGGTEVGSTDLTGDTYPATVKSPPAYVTSAGEYCWRAVFSGDTANGIGGSSDASEGECFTVDPVTPTLTTEAGPDVNLGESVTDTATLSGTAPQPLDPIIWTGEAPPAPGAEAGGTITFTLYGPSNSGCGSLVETTDPVDVTSGDGDYDSPEVTPTIDGLYHWVASYSGDSPNTLGATHNTDCTDSDENVMVNTVATSLTSSQSWVPNDTVTVTTTGGGDLDGTVTFKLYRGADCATGTLLGTWTDDIDGASPQDAVSGNSTAYSATGTFWWEVSYASDNPAQRSIPASCEETTSLTIDNGDGATSG